MRRDMGDCFNMCMLMVHAFYYTVGLCNFSVLFTGTMHVRANQAGACMRTERRVTLQLRDKPDQAIVC